MAENKNTKYITPEIVCSFPYLFEPSDYTEKYGLSIPIPEADKEEVKNIKVCIANAVENKWGRKAVKDIGKKIASPLRIGNEEKEDDSVYKDTVFFSANSAKKPGVVNQQLKPIMSDDELYPGCIIRASVNFYAYDYKGKKGVACGLQNVLFVKDGEYLGAGSNPEDDFSEFKQSIDQSSENTSTDDDNDDDMPF